MPKPQMPEDWLHSDPAIAIFQLNNRLRKLEEKSPVVGRVVALGPAVVHNRQVPVMMELHRDGSVTWKQIYPSRPKHSPSAGAEAAGQAIKDGLSEGLRGHEPRIAYIDEAQEK